MSSTARIIRTTSDSAPTLDNIITLARSVRSVTDGKIDDIQKVANSLRMLALNALIEAARPGVGLRHRRRWNDDSIASDTRRRDLSGPWLVWRHPAEGVVSLR